MQVRLLSPFRKKVKTEATNNSFYAKTAPIIETNSLGFDQVNEKQNKSAF
jgi:hypothetical protein